MKENVLLIFIRYDTIRVLVLFFNMAIFVREVGRRRRRQNKVQRIRMMLGSSFLPVFLFLTGILVGVVDIILQYK